VPGGVVGQNGPMTSEPHGRRLPACPACGAELVPVVFGHPEPGSNLWAMAQRGEVHLAGCSIRIGVPPWWCPACAGEVPDEEAT